MKTHSGTPKKVLQLNHSHPPHEPLHSPLHELEHLQLLLGVVGELLEHIALVELSGQDIHIHAFHVKFPLNLEVGWQRMQQKP
jgi:hypothetical protein